MWGAGRSGVEWRLLWSGPGAAARNMAVDEALLEGCADGSSPPTLRFYTWDPPAVSLGYAQDPEAVIDPDACRRLGIDWIRRPTGGRAVLHGRDLTYSVAAPAHLLPGGVLDVYRRLAEALAAGLSDVGVPAEPVARAAPAEGPRRGGGRAPSPCFLSASRWEIAVGGRKLVGSAQARRRGAVLQHGAIPLVDDSERLAAVLRLEGEAARPEARKALRRASVSLAEILGAVPETERLVQVLAAGFSRALGVRLVPGRLAPAEEAWTAAIGGRISPEVQRNSGTVQRGGVKRDPAHR